MQPKNLLSYVYDSLRPDGRHAEGDTSTVNASSHCMQQGIEAHAMGKMDVMTPTCVMSILSAASATITGAVYVKLFRVK